MQQSNRVPVLSKHRTRSRGFTLIETMIAIIVCFLALLAMLSVVPFGFNNVQSNSIHAQAVAVAQHYLENEHNALLQHVAMPAATSAPIDAGQSFTNHGVANANYGNFTIAPDGCATISIAGTTGVNVYQCSVTISWPEGGSTRSLTEQSLVTK